MKVSMIGAGLTASALAVMVAGCGSDKPASPSSSSPSASSPASSSPSSSSAPSTSAGAQPSDYSNLLIKPTDIAVPGDTFTLSMSTPVPSPAGVDALFANQTGARKVQDTIYVYPDATAARQAFDGMSKSLADPDLGVKGPVTTIDVGSRGTMVVGNAPDGSKSVGMAIFTEGKVFTVLEFNSPPNDSVPAEVVLDLARKQDAAIKAGFPS